MAIEIYWTNFAKKELKRIFDYYKIKANIKKSAPSKEELNAFLASNRSSIQCVVGRDFIPFGKAQCPSLNDYADGIDTMAFLANC